MQANILLIIVGVLGVIVDNQSLIISGFVLLLLRVLELDDVLKTIDNYSVKIGIILIMLGVLASLAIGKQDFSILLERLREPLTLLALVMGILVTQFTREGIDLFAADPTITIVLVIGIIIGVAFFNGMPSGPLIAGGITAVIYQLMSFIF
ncbi:DUF441 family protein [Halanaerobacter jeridensis]|uniref:UPF0756 membrane protein JOC47_001901 n=1 Tax=Halanaerobacter jeridensis TaxID=706427 RepID=A0A939BPG8_9FIRM|nr:DUF441 family protein [Halanaerobacter jeridensis]MBM7557047.1 uncharacterized membrane protein (DUF441 family) [Halanaerobacter jeridensis]